MYNSYNKQNSYRFIINIFYLIYIERKNLLMTLLYSRIIICFFLIILPLNQAFVGTQDSSTTDVAMSETISCSLSFSSNFFEQLYIASHSEPVTNGEEQPYIDQVSGGGENKAQMAATTGMTTMEDPTQAVIDDLAIAQQVDPIIRPFLNYGVLIMEILTNGMPHDYTRIRLNNDMMSHRSVEGCSGMRMMIMENDEVSCEESITVQTDPSSTYYYFHHPETNATHHTIKVFGFTFLDGEYTYTENYAYTQLHRNLVLGSEVQCSSLSFIQGSIGKPIFTIMI